MLITATQLKSNLGEYLDKSNTEDVYITKNGKVYAVLSNPNKEKIKLLRSLYGCIPESVDVEKVKEERMSKK